MNTNKTKDKTNSVGLMDSGELPWGRLQSHSLEIKSSFLFVFIRVHSWLMVFQEHL